MASFQVIYLTGAPASGKSTLGRMLREAGDIEVYHYSELLKDHLNAKSGGKLVEDDLREKSAGIITLADVEAVDNALIERVNDRRIHTHILIDSHPVTKEGFGYRVTGFTYDKLRALNPSVICMLYAESHEILRRIATDSGGRPTVSQFQADFHITLQAQVALAYSLELGLPFYAFDSTESLKAASEKLRDLLKG